MIGGMTVKASFSGTRLSIHWTSFLSMAFPSRTRSGADISSLSLRCLLRYRQATILAITATSDAQPTEIPRRTFGCVRVDDPESMTEEDASLLTGIGRVMMAGISKEKSTVRGK